MNLSKEPIAFCWSGGKDSALTLHRLLQSNKYDIRYLLTTVNENFKRISMHGVREELLEQQAKSIGIPLVKVYVEEGSNEEYERNMEKQLLGFKKEGINKIGFGDIFLEDLKDYRDNNLSRIGMEGLYPIWKENTKKLINEFLEAGFKTVLCCVSEAVLTENYSGKVIDSNFVEGLPKNVDPCGENGEFHTFVFDGPIFKEPISFEIGETVYRKYDPPANDPGLNQTGFWYCDLTVFR